MLCLWPPSSSFQLLLFFLHFFYSFCFLYLPIRAHHVCSHWMQSSLQFLLLFLLKHLLELWTCCQCSRFSLTLSCSMRRGLWWRTGWLPWIECGHAAISQHLVTKQEYVHPTLKFWDAGRWHRSVFVELLQDIFVDLNFDNPFLKTFIEEAWTLCSGKLFHLLTTLLEKKCFGMSFEQLYLEIFNDWPLMHPMCMISWKLFPALVYQHAAGNSVWFRYQNSCLSMCSVVLLILMTAVIV